MSWTWKIDEHEWSCGDGCCSEYRRNLEFYKDGVYSHCLDIYSSYEEDVIEAIKLLGVDLDEEVTD